MQELGYQVWVRQRERRLRSVPQAQVHVMPRKPVMHGGSTEKRAFPRFSMAFQPIVNVVSGRVFGYEALVRSLAGEGAGSVLERVPRRDFHLFDRACRSRALTLAVECGILNDPDARLCVNVNPNAAVTEASSIRHTCEEARAIGFPLDRLVLEIVEDEEIIDFQCLRRTVDKYRACGVQIAMDDFGAGYAGLKVLAKLQPDVVKVDMGLVSQVETDRSAEVIVKAIVQACFELGVEVVAEGVETAATAARLRRMGVLLQQGYFFARPAFEEFPDVDCGLPDPLIG